MARVQRRTVQHGQGLSEQRLRRELGADRATVRHADADAARTAKRAAVETMEAKLAHLPCRRGGLGRDGYAVHRCRAGGRAATDRHRRPARGCWIRALDKPVRRPATLR